MLTKLNAVNACLAGIGLAPVATTDEANLDIDASTALQTVERVTIDLQTKGWWFNKESSWKLTPDSITGYISVPNAAISMITSGVSFSLDLCIRDKKVYDLTNHTFDLRDIVYTDSGNTTGYIEFTFIMNLDFESMPPVARMAAMYTARRQFAQDLEVDERRWKFQLEEESKAYNQLLSEDARNKKMNAFTDSPSIRNFIARAGGPNALGGYRFGY